MKIVVKTLKGEIMNIDSETTDTIADIKGKIKQLKGFELDTQKLVFKGKATANQDTLEKLNVKENDFLVVMTVAKKPEPKKVQKQETKVEQKKTEEQKKQTTENKEEIKHSEIQPSNEQLEEKINNLMGMGFTREKCTQALQAAFNNTDRAVEYLINGIPERPVQPNVTGQMGSQMLAGIVNNPQFGQIRDLIRSNPAALQPILQQISQSSPQLYQLIAQNPQAFQRLIMEGSENAQGTQQVPQVPQVPQIPQPPPGSIVVTHQEQEAIKRLSQLGFSKIQAAQAYMACDKNEELAANLLFDRLANGDIEMQPQGEQPPGGDEDDDDNLFN